MIVEKLTTQFAMKSGSEVWFLPEKPLSSWAKYLDWHMNFLIANSSLRVKKNITETLKNTLHHEEIKLDINLPNEYDIILLSTKGFLPNNATVLVRHCNDIEKWIEKIQDTIERLKIAKARIFLPKGVSTQQAGPYLRKKLSNVELSLVEDHVHEK